MTATSGASNSSGAPRRLLSEHPVYAVLTLIAALLSVVVALIGLNSGALYADPVIRDRAQALYFLRSYYTQSVAEPTTCCYSELSGHYTTYRNVSLSSYITFFNTLSQVKVLSLDVAQGDYFRANMQYKPRKGKSILENDLFSLRCKERKWRWQSCDAEQIVIWDYIGDVK